MDELHCQCHKIISAVNAARNLYIEAIKEAKNKNFINANRKVKEGEAMFNQGHIAHASLIQKEASGDHVKVSLLLIHAEDKLMSAEAFQIIASELIDSYKRICTLEENGNVS